MGSNSECFALKWKEFHTSVANCFSDLRTEEDFLDVTVAIDQEHQLPAHKVILSASSPYFREILKRNPAQHPVLVMPPHVRFTDLSAILDFIYQGEVKVPSAELNEFIDLAKMLKIRGLTEEFETFDNRKMKAQPRLPPGTQMRKRPGGPTPPHQPSPSPQTKRPRNVMMPPNKFMGGPSIPPGPPTNFDTPEEGEGIDEEDVHEVDDEDSNDLYGDYEESYENQEYPMDQPPHPAAPPPPPPQGGSQPGTSAAGLTLTGLVCPTCHQMCYGVPALKEHMTKVHGIPGESSSSTPNKPGDELNQKKFACQICDKPFKAAKNVQAHIKRVHKVEAGQSAEPDGSGEAGSSMDPQHPPEMPSPGKKKGRPKKSEQLFKQQLQQQQGQQGPPGPQQQHHPQGPQQQQHQVPQQQQREQQGNMSNRPIGQVPPAPRTPHDMKDMPEQAPRPPVQQDRGASPMMARPRPTGMMSPQTGPGPAPPPKRPMGIMGPGMRPRGPMPQQFQPGFHPQQGGPMDIRKLGMKLGGAISITSSEPGGSGGPQPSIRRPAPSTSRVHASSPKNDPLATSVSRPPSIPSSRSGSMSHEAPPVEVKEEPMDDIYDEGEEEMHEEYEDEGEAFGEEEEDEDEDQDYGQGSMGDMYGSDAPYDDDVDHEGGAYQQ